MPEQGRFVQSRSEQRRRGNDASVFYVGRDWTATVVRHNDQELVGYVHHLYPGHAIFDWGSQSWVEVPGCPLWVQKHVPEEYRA